MTLIPPGAHLAPTDLPPPPPQSDPREPSSTPIRGRGASTPRRVHSPQPSRGTSPVRPAMQRTPSSDRSPLSSPPKAASPPLHAPTPRSHRASASSGFPAGLGAVLASGGPNSTSTPHHNSLHPHLSRPASPASINSSASAIFERDIEVPAVASLSLNPNASAPHTLSHKPSRLTHPTHGSTLDHTVPAVLDDAVEALTASEGQSRGFEGLEIEAPAPVSAVGMARQSSASLPIAGRKFSSAQGQSTSLSRSPSPASVGSGNSPIASPANSPPIMGQLSSSISSQSSREKSPTGLQGHPIIGAGATAKAIDSTASARSEASVPRPAMSTRMSTGPILPGGWAFGYGGNTAAEEEQVTESAPPSAEPPIPNANDEAEKPSASASPVNPSAQGSQQQPLPAVPSLLTPSKDKRRISFVSYNDLLLSVPTTVTHLSEITSGQLSPDHLPGTVSPTVSMGMSSRSPMLGDPTSETSPGPAGLGLGHRPSWEGRAGSGAGVGLGMGGEGEWEREGLGKGLEQRLEDLARDQVQANPLTPTPGQTGSGSLVAQAK